MFSLREMSVKPFLRLLIYFSSLSIAAFEEHCYEDDSVNCLMRFELQFDFQVFHASDECESCRCLNGFDVMYINHPPYIYQDAASSQPTGLFVGKFWEIEIVSLFHIQLIINSLL